MLSFLLLILEFSFSTQVVWGQVGINYGTIADNLPPPRQVARFLATSTTITRVRIFDANPEILKAFANTGIAVTITASNELIPNLTRPSFARQWVRSHVAPHLAATNIIRILIGNEVLSTGNKPLILNLVPAMQTLQTALATELPDDMKIKISTPHSMGVVSTSGPPSTGRFPPGYDSYVLKPLLEFLRATGSPFMVNPYPFFTCSEENLDYALFRPNRGVLDERSNVTYGNMLDAQLDAVFWAMRRLGYDDLDIVIAETGWASRGDAGQIGVDVGSAAEYNRKLIRHLTSGVGTPLVPNRTFETYIFALFDEDLKAGPTCERNFGLFRPNLTPAYDVGIVKLATGASCGGGGGGKIGGGACLLLILLSVVAAYWIL